MSMTSYQEMGLVVAIVVLAHIPAFVRAWRIDKQNSANPNE